MMPFSQHTYLWYCYDPVSKTLVYLARPSLLDGIEVQLGDDPSDVFVYEAEEARLCKLGLRLGRRNGCTGRASAARSPTRGTCRSPGRPRACMPRARTVSIAARSIAQGPGRRGRRSTRTSPSRGNEIKYHYEFQPLRHDTRRDRLILTQGRRRRVDVFARALTPEGKWRQIETSGSAAIGREAVYIARHDTLLWLADKRLFAFDCATNRMASLRSRCPKGSTGTSAHSPTTPSTTCAWP